MDYISGPKFVDVLMSYAVSPEFQKKMDDIIQENINKILLSAYNQLTHGGFLVVHEDVTPADSVDFSKETAENIGYIVKQLDRQEAILQKPLTK